MRTIYRARTTSKIEPGTGGKGEKCEFFCKSLEETQAVLRRKANKHSARQQMVR